MFGGADKAQHQTHVLMRVPVDHKPLAAFRAWLSRILATRQIPPGCSAGRTSGFFLFALPAELTQRAAQPRPLLRRPRPSAWPVTDPTRDPRPGCSVSPLPSAGAHRGAGGAGSPAAHRKALERRVKRTGRGSGCRTAGTGLSGDSDRATHRGSVAFPQAPQPSIDFPVV